MNRICPFCGGVLQWVSGHDVSARERGGNAREEDSFACSGCPRRFHHSVSERFSGNLEGWYVKENPAVEHWTELAPPQWPRSG